MTGLPADDRGLLLGDGLFETVLFKAGRPVLWQAHLDRLMRGCLALGLPPPDAGALAAEADAAIAAAGLSGARAAVRLTWTAGSGGRGLDRPQPAQPRLIVSAALSAAPPGPARLITSAVRRNEHSPASRLKTLSYLDNVLARRDASAAGADEALMLNGQGLVACACAANLFWISDGRLYTPALDCGVLDGIMRSQVMAAEDVREVAAPASALKGAEALFLTSSLIGLRQVSALDGAVYGGHPLIEALTRTLAASV